MNQVPKWVGIIVLAACVLWSGGMARGEEVTSSVAFGAPITLQWGFAPTSLKVADLDADGDSDLVCIRYATKEVVVAKNNGGGSFGSLESYSFFDGPSSLGVADFNGDGYLDITTSNQTGISGYSGGYVLTNAGDGTFSARKAYTLGDPFKVIIAAALDSDSLADLILQFETSHSVVTCKNLGGGKFGPAYSISFGGFTPSGFCPVDYDSNGVLDFVCTDGSKLATMRGLGGTFEKDQEISLPTYGVTGSLLVADVTGNSLVDLVTGAHYNSVGIFPGYYSPANSAYGFATSWYVPVASIYQIAAADFNHDGLVDLAYTTQTATDSIGVLVNVGPTNGNFVVDRKWPIAAYPSNIAAAEVNGDGKPDLLMTTSQGVTILLNTWTATSIRELTDAIVPSTFSLSQNYPNPFNATTDFQFSVPTQSRVTLQILNVLGQVVATVYDGECSAGTFAASWNARNAQGETVSSGMYFYRLSAGEHVSTRKLLLLK